MHTKRFFLFLWNLEEVACNMAPLQGLDGFCDLCSGGFPLRSMSYGGTSTPHATDTTGLPALKGKAFIEKDQMSITH
jgi:hypothetical protein